MDLELDYTGPVAVFPLPNVVLFPGALLPLHIFEPRYRAMVADALDSDRLIAIALLAEGWEQDYQGTPDIHQIATVGRVVRHRQLPDGRSNILLEGLARVRAKDELPPAPYRRAQVEVCEEQLTLESLETASQLARDVDELVLDLYLSAPPLFGAAIGRPGGVMSPGRYFDHVGEALKVDPRIKQALLDDVDVVDRGHKLKSILTQINEIALSKDDDEEEDGGIDELLGGGEDSDWS